MEEQKRFVLQMAKVFEEDANLLGKLKNDPDPRAALQAAGAKAAEQLPAYFQDKLLYRIAVIVLGSLALIAALGSIMLVLQGKTTPEVLVALGSAAVGALVGLFAPSPAGGRTT
jgi:hypothetical protein